MHSPSVRTGRNTAQAAKAQLSPQCTHSGTETSIVFSAAVRHIYPGKCIFHLKGKENYGYY